MSVNFPPNSCYLRDLDFKILTFNSNNVIKYKLMTKEIEVDKLSMGSYLSLWLIS